MKTINKIDDMQAAVRELKRAGKTIAFVPTMGFLHNGHASLLKEARKNADILVLSIFVNPIQFGQNEDLDRYPRDLENDSRIAGECGVDIIFTPQAADMYPAGFQTGISVAEVSKPLCGASRPGHFDGVTTVVAKLFNIIQPDLAFFGRKDYQQLSVIKRMTADLCIPVQIVGMPIIREEDGLAMSSRNVYLTAEERNSALSLSRAIKAVRSSYSGGQRSIELLRQEAMTVLGRELPIQIDYLEFCNEATLQPIQEADDDTLMAIAVKIGKTRLIDNTVLGDSE